jgi:hypothetical protein
MLFLAGFGRVTLLIGTVLDTNIVITADGVSKAGATIQSHNLQKVFPLRDLPFVIAHHGLNLLNDCPVQAFLQPFIEKMSVTSGPLKVSAVLEELREFADAACRNALRNSTGRNIVAFWVGGFSAGKFAPEMHEIYWKKTSSKPSQKKFGRLVFGGNGKKMLPRPGACSPEGLARLSGGDVAALHGRLYEQALQKQRDYGGAIFGGHVHQIAITKDGWVWRKRPAVQSRC